uniref:Uncharacterized protein n=1 Tax=Timema cristinae TaxID=61476 RepID=A0A7R9D820_TIMCR|nr:unnamed protein product [Timema cristinae]
METSGGCGKWEVRRHAATTVSFECRGSKPNLVEFIYITGDVLSGSARTHTVAMLVEYFAKSYVGVIRSHPSTLIVILSVRGTLVRKFMLAAYNLGMTRGDWTFLDVELFHFGAPAINTTQRKKARRAPLSTTISNRLTASWRPTTSAPRPSRSFGKIPLSLLEAPGRSPFPSNAQINHVGSANYIFACLLEEWQNTSGDDWETSTTLTGHAFTSGLRNLHNLHRTCGQGKWVPWTEGSRRANLIQGLDLSSKLQV